MIYSRRFSLLRPKTIFSIVCVTVTMLFQINATTAGPVFKIRQWELSYPALPVTWLNSVCWGDPGGVAVGNEGTILFSPDGSDWSLAKPPLLLTGRSEQIDLEGVCYGNGVFVAVGNHYPKVRILRSEDGLSWREVPSGVADASASGIAFGNGQFVVTTGKQILLSTDGLSWEEKEGGEVRKLAYGEGKWVGVGEYSVMSTTDFVEWQHLYSADGYLTDITYANGRFVTLGGGYFTGSPWSEDGVKWENGWMGGGQGCAGANGRFVVVDGFTTRSSADGKKWSQGKVSNHISDVGYGGLQAVVVAKGRPYIAVGSYGQIWKSSDGVNWKNLTPYHLARLSTIVHADRGFVAIGGDEGTTDYKGPSYIFSSFGGLEWDSFDTKYRNPYGVAFGDGLWVVTGQNGMVYTSPDARNWEDRTIRGPATQFYQLGENLAHVTYGAGRFVAFSVGRDRIYHSTDGIKWQAKDGPPVTGVNAAAYINGRFVAVGDGGLILLSSNGLDWVRQPVGFTDDLYSVCYGNGAYVASTWKQVVTSRDGRNWKRRLGSQARGGIFFRNGWFLSGNFRFSKDGVEWHPVLFDAEASKLRYLVDFDGHDAFASGWNDMEIWKAPLKLPKTETKPTDLSGSFRSR